MNNQIVRERVVPVEIALSLKQKGFDWKISYYYYYHWAHSCQDVSGYDDYYIYSENAWSNSDWERTTHELSDRAWNGYAMAQHPPISAPSYDMTIDWLMQQGYYVGTAINRDGKFYSVVKDMSSDQPAKAIPVSFYGRYEALNQAIQYALKRVNDK